MKALCLKDINSYENLIDKLFSLIDRINPDIIICLGGLFKENKVLTNFKEIPPSEIKTKFGVKPKKSLKNNQKNSTISQTVVLEQLAIFGIPVLLIPNKNDLNSKFAVKRAKNTENILYRWLDSKITSIEGWIFLGLSNISLISNYMNYNMFNSNSILCSTDDPILLEKILAENKNSKPKFFLFSEEFKSITIPNIICYHIKSLTKEIINFIDFASESFEEIQI